MRKHIICPKCGWEFDLFSPLEKKVLLTLKNEHLSFTELKGKTHASNQAISTALNVLVAMGLVERILDMKYALKPEVNLATLTDFH